MREPSLSPDFQQTVLSITASSVSRRVGGARGSRQGVPGRLPTQPAKVTGLRCEGITSDPFCRCIQQLQVNGGTDRAWTESACTGDRS